MRDLLICILSLACGLSQAAASDAVGNWGITFNPRCPIAVKVSKRTFDAIPTNIAVLAVDHAQFPSDGVKLLINYALTNAAEREALAKKIDTDPHFLSDGKITLKDDTHGRLRIDRQNGILLYEHGPQDEPKVPLDNTGSNQLSFASFNQIARDLVDKLHIDEGEIARKRNGDFDIVVSDNERFPHHQKEAVLYERSVIFSRTANGFKMLPGYAGFFQIDLVRFVNGQWSRIYIYWPRLKAVGSCRSYQSDEAIKEAIESNRSLWDQNNEIVPEGVKKVTVTGLRIVYYTSREGISIPVTCLDCDMKTDHGTDYGVLFLPLEKNP